MRQALSSSLAVWNEDGIECEVWVFFAPHTVFPHYHQSNTRIRMRQESGELLRGRAADAGENLRTQKNASLCPSSPTRVLHII